MARNSDSCLTPAVKGEEVVQHADISEVASVMLRVYNRAVHFGLSRAWKAHARTFFSTTLAAGLVPQSRLAGHTCPRLDPSGRGPVIVIQHAAQALTTLNLSRASEVAGFWTDE